MSDFIPLLSVEDLACFRSTDQATFTNVSFIVNDGDVLVLSGRSGSGKTTLLKCISHLNIYDGEVFLRGRTVSAENPSDLRHDEPPISLAGVPLYRTRVLYVPQRPALLPATPRDFLNRVSSYASRAPDKTKGKETLRAQTSVWSIHTLAVAHIAKPGTMHGPVRIAEVWGIDEALWDRPWSSLSGGEAQRIALSVAVGLEGAEVLLLDEPTSALDAETTALVETSLRGLIDSDLSTVKAIIWITHSEGQSRRVGTRFLSMEDGGCMELMEMGLSLTRDSRASSILGSMSTSLGLTSSVSLDPGAD